MSATATPTPTHIELSQASALFPRDGSGRAVHVSTLRRWARLGVRTTDGRVVRLKTFKVGVRRLTTAGDVADFIGELNRSAPEGQDGRGPTYSASRA